MFVRGFIIVSLALMPLRILAQSDFPVWISDEYRLSQYPSNHWYTGFAVDNKADGELLISALSRVEQSAKNQLTEQIFVHIESNSQLTTDNRSYVNNQNSMDQVRIDYHEEVRTYTAASLVGVDVKTHYDSNTQQVYAFAYVERSQLINYYRNQEQAIYLQVEKEISVIEELVNAAQKITAYERSLDAISMLKQAKYYRNFLSIVEEGEAAYSETYDRQAKYLERQLVVLKQGTQVYVSCTWTSDEYPQYEHLADLVRENVETLLIAHDCSIIDDPQQADYLVELCASTTQRGDGKNGFGMVSYYADIVGKMKNRRTGKSVANISLMRDSRLYAAGVDENQAIIKAFKLKQLMDILQEAIVSGLDK